MSPSSHASRSTPRSAESVLFAVVYLNRLRQHGADGLGVLGPERLPGKRLGVRGPVAEPVRVGRADGGDGRERATHGPTATGREPGEVDRGRVGAGPLAADLDGGEHRDGKSSLSHSVIACSLQS